MNSNILHHEKSRIRENSFFGQNQDTQAQNAQNEEKVFYTLDDIFDTLGSDNLERENLSSNTRHYRRVEDFQAGEFAAVERKFQETNYFDFTTGSNKIHSPDDVAYLLRQLENEAVEHAFAVYVDKDKNYQVQWLSMGSALSTIVEESAIIYGAAAFDAKEIYFVHNHPSGYLKASAHDRKIFQKLQTAFKHFDMGITGIIINLNSGKYLVFDKTNDIVNDVNNQELPKEPYKPSVLSFSKQSFLLPPASLTELKSPADAAQFISAIKFGGAEKTGYLMLNTAMQAVGNFFLKSNTSEDILKDMAVNASRYKARGIILYGNHLSQNICKYLQKTLPNFGLELYEHIATPPGEFVNSTVAEIIRENNTLDTLKHLSSNPMRVKEAYQKYFKGNKNITSKDARQFLNDVHTPENNPSYKKTVEKKGEQDLSPITLQMYNEDNSITTFRSNGEKEIEYINNILLEQNIHQHQNSNTMTNEQQTPQTEKIQKTNAEFLQEQVKYTGFKLSEPQQKELTDKLLSKEQEGFSIELKNEHKVNGVDAAIDYRLNFNKSATSDNYFFNSFDAALTKNENGKDIQRTQNFQIANKGKGQNITALEAFNLLDGRHINKDLVNKEGEKANYWVSLDFNSLKKDNGNHLLNMFHENYGFSLKETLDKYPITLNGTSKDRLAHSLEKGNRVELGLLQDGVNLSVFAQANPQMKALDFFDKDGTKLFIKQESTKEQKQEEAPEQKQSKKESKGLSM